MKGSARYALMAAIIAAACGIAAPVARADETCLSPYTAALVKGQAVTVRGYEHEQRYTRRDGSERREVEIYAAAVTRSKAT